MKPREREDLRNRLGALGFDAVGFARLDPHPDAGLRDWLQAGHHADMDWLARSADKRLDPQLVLPGARTVILLGVNYWPGPGVTGKGFARYSLHRDYHDTIKPGLVAAGRLLEEAFGIGGADYRYYVDAGPVMERGWGALAGVGFRGKNGNLVSRELGNWLLLAAIFVRAEIEPDRPLPRTAGPGPGAYCGTCTRCIDACPTKAFPAPGLVDARRCISYHTIENRGFIPRELRSAFGERVFGCDECLAVCPWNRFARIGRSELLERRHDLAELGLLDLLRLSSERFREVFRGTSIKRTKWRGIVRNACIAAGNRWAGQGGGAAAAEVELELLRLAAHESPVVRGHAVWALRRISTAGRVVAELARLRLEEHDPQVQAEYDA